jgi:DNA-directed RNA polymerase specialized sigma24 family protein
MSADTPDPEQISQASQQMSARYRWRFLTPTRLAQRMAQLLAESRTPAGDLPVLCKQAASIELYNALHTAATQEIAYADLSSYLTVVAGRLPPPRPDVSWDDLVQDTLIDVQQKYATCEVPAAFLAWAVTILKRKGMATWRREPTLSLEALAARDETTLNGEWIGARDRHVDPLGDQELLRLLHDCLDSDEERAWALWIALGLKRREWSMVFDAPVPHFDWLRVRVQRKLRHCPRFRLLVARSAGAACPAHCTGWAKAESPRP